MIAIEAKPDSAQLLIDRFQAALKDYNTQTDRTYKLSVSVGLAYLDPKERSSIEALMARADEALYKQKHIKPTRTT